MRSKDPGKLFGTDGIRGEAGKFPLDSRTIRLIGSSLAQRLAEASGAQAPRIITGRDTRESGSWIERDLVVGMREAGGKVQSAGIITTPGVAFLTRALHADAGVVISASHNPFRDNGIKVFAPSGRKLNDATERLIEKDVADALSKAVKFTRQPSGPAGDQPDFEGDRNVTDLQGRYLEFLEKEVARDLSLGNLTMVVDCANGAAYEMAPKLFRHLGARVIAINAEPDGRNINRECGSLYMEGLQRKVVADRADLGVAFDGDADRALFVDAKGNLVDGDATMWLMANFMKSRGELTGDIVVATVMSNLGLEVTFHSRGIKLVRTDVGDKYVLDELLRSGAAIGGEQSGHIIFPKLSLAGDGMITTICLLEALCAEDRSLHELTESFRRFPQVLVNIVVREKKSFDKLPATQRIARDVQKRLGERGRLLLRYSGTEPLARIMIEGESESEINAYAGRLAEAIKAELGPHGS